MCAWGQGWGFSAIISFAALGSLMLLLQFAPLHKSRNFSQSKRSDLSKDIQLDRADAGVQTWIWFPPSPKLFSSIFQNHPFPPGLSEIFLPVVSIILANYSKFCMISKNGNEKSMNGSIHFVPLYHLQSMSLNFSTVLWDSQYNLYFPVRKLSFRRVYTRSHVQPGGGARSRIQFL